MELEPVPVNVDLSTYSCTVAQGGDKVYKDECVFCFNSPVSASQASLSSFSIRKKALTKMLRRRKVTLRKKAIAERRKK